MVSAKTVRQTIREVEGFEVEILSPDGSDISRRRVEEYLYIRAAKQTGSSRIGGSSGSGRHIGNMKWRS